MKIRKEDGIIKLNRSETVQWNRSEYFRREVMILLTDVAFTNRHVSMSLTLQTHVALLYGTSQDTNATPPLLASMQMSQQTKPKAPKLESGGAQSK